MAKGGRPAPPKLPWIHRKGNRPSWLYRSIEKICISLVVFNVKSFFGWKTVDQKFRFLDSFPPPSCGTVCTPPMENFLSIPLKRGHTGIAVTMLILSENIVPKSELYAFYPVIIFMWLAVLYDQIDRLVAGADWGRGNRILAPLILQHVKMIELCQNCYGRMNGWIKVIFSV